MNRHKDSHPAYSTDVDGPYPDGHGPNRRFRNLKPMSSKHDFETEEERLDGVIQGAAQINLFDDIDSKLHSNSRE